MTTAFWTKDRPAKVRLAEDSASLQPPCPQVIERPRRFPVGPRIKTAVFLLVLTAVTVAIYRPALHRVFAGDQLCYLAELNGSASLWDGLQHYDYAVTRQYWKGDESLYRPLLFVWLALNHWAFASDYFWWNLVNLSLHVVVAALLYVLLRTLQPSPAAGAFALLFAVLTSAIDLVVWNHLGGYLAGFACFLVGLIAAHRAVDVQQPSKIPWLAVYVLSMTVASLFYEMLVAMAAIVTVYLFYGEFRRAGGIRWRIVLASLIPVAIFTGLYVIHGLQCPRFFYADNVRHGDYAVMLAVDQALRQIENWLKQTFCPWNYAYIPRPFQRSYLRPVNMSGTPVSMLCIVIAAVVLLLAGLYRRLHLTHFMR